MPSALPCPDDLSHRPVVGPLVGGEPRERTDFNTNADVTVFMSAVKSVLDTARSKYVNEHEYTEEKLRAGIDVYCERYVIRRTETRCWLGKQYPPGAWRYDVDALWKWINHSRRKPTWAVSGKTRYAVMLGLLNELYQAAGFGAGFADEDTPVSEIDLILVLDWFGARGIVGDITADSSSASGPEFKSSTTACG